MNDDCPECGHRWYKHEKGLGCIDGWRGSVPGMGECGCPAHKPQDSRPSRWRRLVEAWR